MASTMTLMKVAIRRNEGYPMGQPAPCHLICPCGHRIPIVGNGGHCFNCGQNFDGRGYLLSKDAPEADPTVYRNTHFTKRNYECTNVVACEVVDEGAKIPDGYEPGDADFRTYARNLTPLWIEAGIRYLGYL